MIYLKWNYCFIAHCTALLEHFCSLPEIPHFSNRLTSWIYLYLLKLYCIYLFTSVKCIALYFAIVRKCKHLIFYLKATAFAAIICIKDLLITWKTAKSNKEDIILISFEFLIQMDFQIFTHQNQTSLGPRNVLCVVVVTI
jgi:hypothetical protein